MQISDNLGSDLALGIGGLLKQNKNKFLECTESLIHLYHVSDRRQLFCEDLRGFVGEH